MPLYFPIKIKSNKIAIVAKIGYFICCKIVVDSIILVILARNKCKNILDELSWILCYTAFRSV
ncbi:hypothetical protein CQA40_09605 [Helicobacter sp. MIT 01-3238]|nr:hypothetical protein CQA40_09605 [Helicobacter sp. MIT 01-3238]